MQAPQQFQLSQGKADPNWDWNPKHTTTTTTAKHTSAALWRLLAPFGTSCCTLKLHPGAELKFSSSTGISAPSSRLPGSNNGAQLPDLLADLPVSCQITLILLEAATASHSHPFPRAAPDTLMFLRGPQQSQKLLQDLGSEPGPEAVSAMPVATLAIHGLWPGNSQSSNLLQHEF